jgi:hypothetical protein
MLQWRDLVNTVMIARPGVLTAATKNVAVFWDVLRVETGGSTKLWDSSREVG